MIKLHVVNCKTYRYDQYHNPSLLGCCRINLAGCDSVLAGKAVAVMRELNRVVMMKLERCAGEPRGYRVCRTASSSFWAVEEGDGRPEMVAWGLSWCSCTETNI